ncbi:type VI secretion system protein TssA [Lysobacter sp. F6437]|uniref:type VI secretion system protein TssA n=1 Tax=Lysobacter sp. F6437 TaxID=3459296 RepID=UPI00403E3373
MLELEELLSPISDARPSGEDLSFSLEYDAIQEARRADDPSLEQGEWVTELKSADWVAVARQSSQLLQQRSKDLRLAVWWAEAQTRSHDFVGLARGYRLVARLCDLFWDDVHPQVEDGDLEQRIGNISWLIGHSTEWLRELPLTQAPQGRFGLADFEAARGRHGDNSTEPTLETLEAARRDTPHAFYLRLTEQLPDCREALAELEQAVDARLGQDGPSFTSLRDQLNHLCDTANRFAREAGVLVDGEPSVGVGSELEPGTSTPSVIIASGNSAIGTRKEAIAQLRRVAEYFRRTEPHSPVAYLADKAASWGEMPLHVWLKRVIKDGDTLAQMEEMLDVGDGLPGHD